MDGDDNNDTPVLQSTKNVKIVVCNFQSAGISCTDRYTLSIFNKTNR
jgi:hypothetical protein